MYGFNDLKEHVKSNKLILECPVNNCVTKWTKDNVSSKPQCNKHNIYLHSKTFVHFKEEDNLLWKDDDDKSLLKTILEKKRESRMAHDNSEDAVSWNIFRFLEKNNLLVNVLSNITGENISCPEIIYWSYNQNEKTDWSILNNARREFGERIDRGSEPDIIIITNKVLFFLEAKFTSGNETQPTNINDTKKYLTGGENWYSQVFKSNYDAVAIKEKKYELMRFWLLGTWMAKQMNLKFRLINLVRSVNETNIEAEFKKCISEDDNKVFNRMTWEDIYILILNSNVPDKEIILNYFKNKTIGYNSNGLLERAFSV